ncbi:MAG: DNA polymerase I [Deltaproteobacteria bacterium]|nr:DNA polymerase I [Deltaproteobacteria bacterium]
MSTTSILRQPPFDEALYLIDVSGFVFRFFFSVRNLTTSKGEPTGALFGVTKMLHKVVADHTPRFLGVAMDSRTPTFRQELYPAYKANRPAPPEDLRPQFGFVREMLEAFGIPALQRDGFEADDVMATVATKVAPERPVVIISSDKDLCQLVTDRVLLYVADKDEVYGPAEVEAKWGVPPERMIDLQALVGDATDNVPGVPGVGPKTAAKLLAEFGSLEALLAGRDRIKNPRMRQLLEEHGDAARKALPLVALRRDAPVEWSLETLRWAPPDPERLRAAYKRFEFHTLAADLPSAEGAPGAPAAGGAEADLAPVRSMDELRALVARIREAGMVSVDTETTALDPMQAELVGISLSVDPGVGRYVPVAHSGADAAGNLPRDEVLDVLRPVLADPAIAKIGQHIKYDSIVLARSGAPLSGATFDTMLASYLLDPEKHQHRLEQIAQERLSRGMISYEEVTEKRRGHQLRFDEVSIDRAARYSAEDAEVVRSLYDPMRRALEEAGLTGLLGDLELPLSEVLVALEMTGISVDPARLRRLAKELAVEAGLAEQEAHQLAGRPFNLGSPKQLAEVLFDQLGLPTVKKTKTGRSTDAEVLEELAAMHPLPSKVLQYRSLTRLVSGYLEALPTLINQQTGRIHTSYNQAVAATGRLSSSNPNLQNIPVRTDVGRRIREAFGTEEGWRIVSADYSQIELRILAHLSEDALLCESFRLGEDVHARTAREVFGAIAGGAAVTELRRRAKVINFGIIYGKTDFGLARELGIPKSQARQFIADYFARYEGVRRYLDRAVEDARATGMVRTMLGRRRFLPDLKSRNPAARGQAERMAMNTPIQGSAADLLKLAMIRVHRELGASKLRARMLLTVHDELVFECPEEEVGDLTALARRCMESAATLSVPLVVDVGSGPTWGRAH